MGFPWGYNPLTHSPPKISSSSFSSTSEAEIPIEQRGDEEVKYAEVKRMVFEKGGLWVECRIPKNMTHDKSYNESEIVVQV